MSWQLALQIIGMVGGTAGVGTIIVKLVAHWLDHLLAKRKQTDEVAMGLVEQLRDEIERINRRREEDRELAKLENQTCHAEQRALRAELHLIETSFETLTVALKYALPERVPEIIAEMIDFREERKARQAARRGETDNAVQAGVSTLRVERDAAAAR